jgi:transposase-like protein
MSHYSAERKEVILKQLLPPHNRTVTEVSAHEGISTATLYNWRNKAKLEGVPVPGRSKSSEDWSGEAKLAVVVETITVD